MFFFLEFYDCSERGMNPPLVSTGVIMIDVINSGKKPRSEVRFTISMCLCTCIRSNYHGYQYITIYKCITYKSNLGVVLGYSVHDNKVKICTFLFVYL